MAVTKVNAENWVFEVDVDGIPTWTVIKGVEDFDINDNTTRADTTDFDSEGVEENRIIRRGKSLTINGHFLEDEADGSRDPGQDFIDTAALAVGTAAEVDMQVTTPGGTIEAFTATVERSNSGDKNDVSKFSYTLTRTGGSTVT